MKNVVTIDLSVVEEAAVQFLDGLTATVKGYAEIVNDFSISISVPASVIEAGERYVAAGDALVKVMDTKKDWITMNGKTVK